jgi:hypothetical protein
MTKPDLREFSSCSYNRIKQSIDSLETALYFAFAGEEEMFREAERLHLKGEPTIKQTEEYLTLCEYWRNQQDTCVSIAKAIQLLNPEFRDERFRMAYGRNQVICVKPYKERQEEKLLIGQK